MVLPFHRAAVAERDAALRYYRAIDARLAHAFHQAIEARLEVAARLPESGPRVPDAPEESDLRWYRISRFPYSLIVARFAEHRVVVALAHHKRRPGYWKGRLLY